MLAGLPVKFKPDWPGNVGSGGLPGPVVQLVDPAVYLKLTTFHAISADTGSINQ